MNTIKNVYSYIYRKTDLLLNKSGVLMLNNTFVHYFCKLKNMHVHMYISFGIVETIAKG